VIAFEESLRSGLRAALDCHGSAGIRSKAVAMPLSLWCSWTAIPSYTT
jgi:hypothetical protein